MVVIKIKGGLGNQMFQYALYLTFKNIGTDVKMDISGLDLYLDSYGRGDIWDAFCVNKDFANAEEIQKLLKNENKIINKLQMKIFKYSNTHYIQRNPFYFNTDIFNMDNVYLDGYWQNEKYFKEYRKSIIEHFKIKKELSNDNNLYLDMIDSYVNSVSLHIRLGDYTTKTNKKIYGGICTPGYYKKAINYFEDNYNNPVFFIFSNDVRNVKHLIDSKKYILVDCNDEKNAWADLYLMSKCKHNIIANSTFSWWGAWLNQNEKKTVLAPSKMMNTIHAGDIYPDSWIKVQ